MTRACPDCGDPRGVSEATHWVCPNCFWVDGRSTLVKHNKSISVSGRFYIWLKHHAEMRGVTIAQIVEAAVHDIAGTEPRVRDAPHRPPT